MLPSLFVSGTATATRITVHGVVDAVAGDKVLDSYVIKSKLLDRLFQSTNFCGCNTFVGSSGTLDKDYFRLPPFSQDIQNIVCMKKPTLPETSFELASEKNPAVNENVPLGTVPASAGCDASLQGSNTEPLSKKETEIHAAMVQQQSPSPRDQSPNQPPHYIDGERLQDDGAGDQLLELGYEGPNDETSMILLRICRNKICTSNVVKLFCPGLPTKRANHTCLIHQKGKLSINMKQLTLLIVMKSLVTIGRSRNSNPIVPTGRRSKLSKTEKKQLRSVCMVCILMVFTVLIQEPMEKFAPQDNGSIPWVQILKYVSDMFHRTCLPSDLRVKWRHIVKKASS
ncbi:hypothetical protein PR202_gb05592 [Eleusine coracana subsp. coracana]|uniref:Uncharacterized protein n=1 Tax=Eleusine coracana subsp. coracana TaxID=191504 RepID=A0AAV5E5R0_ELECO|nr:hypothetical protein PR202_gb05592 [Eleusine coracana subsp. coracana]